MLNRRWCKSYGNTKLWGLGSSEDHVRTKFHGNPFSGCRDILSNTRNVNLKVALNFPLPSPSNQPTSQSLIDRFHRIWWCRWKQSATSWQFCLRSDKHWTVRQKITEVIRVYPVRTINVCFKKKKDSRIHPKVFFKFNDWPASPFLEPLWKRYKTSDTSNQLKNHISDVTTCL